MVDGGSGGFIHRIVPGLRHDGSTVFSSANAADGVCHAMLGLGMFLAGP